MLETMRKWYRVAAILFLNAVVLLFVLLLGLRLFVPVRQPGPIYSQGFDLASYVRTSPEDALAVGLEFDRMGEQSSYEFDPWTMFRERVYHGTLLNVDEGGIRRTLAPDPARSNLPHTNAEPLRVWVLGGSTVFGWAMPDAQTIPSHLQGLLQATFSERHVEVTNHGHSYFYSSMELSDFLRLLRAGERPHIAVILDGLNDALYLTLGHDAPFFSDVLHSGWERERERQLAAAGDLPWVTFNRSLPLFRLIERLQAGPEPGAGFEVSPRYQETPADPIAWAVERYRFNHRAILAAGKEFGVDIVHLLQPVTFYASGIPAGDRPPPVSFYDALLGDLPAGLDSAVEALREVARAYVDWGHYSDQGCHEVARAIAETIARRGTTTR